MQSFRICPCLAGEATAMRQDSGDPDLPRITEVTELHTYYYMEDCPQHRIPTWLGLWLVQHPSAPHMRISRCPNAGAVTMEASDMLTRDRSNCQNILLLIKDRRLDILLLEIVAQPNRHVFPENCPHGLV